MNPDPPNPIQCYRDLFFEAVQLTIGQIQMGCAFQSKWSLPLQAWKRVDQCAEFCESILKVPFSCTASMWPALPWACFKLFSDTLIRVYCQRITHVRSKIPLSCQREFGISFMSHFLIKTKQILIHKRCRNTHRQGIWQYSKAHVRKQVLLIELNYNFLLLRLFHCKSVLHGFTAPHCP